jgi:nitrous oxidase accessory protein
MSLSSSTGFNVEQSSTRIYDGKTLYVGGSGPGNYSKIQDAIDNSSDGDTVFVYNGTYIGYNGNIFIYKAINLIGEDRNSTFIDCDEITIGGMNISKDLLITGFTIETIIEIGSTGNATFTKNNILGYDYDGILGDQSGIFIRSFGNFFIIDNEISGWNNSGIYCEVGLWTGLTILNNVFSDNRETGIILKGRGHLITNNIFMNNGDGLYLEQTYECNISDNTFINNRCCLGLRHSNYNRICHNNFIKTHNMVYFFSRSLSNFWDGNYWGRPRLLPKPIRGSIGIFIPWFNFDWHPAQEPYDIEV